MARKNTNPPDKVLYKNPSLTSHAALILLRRKLRGSERRTRPQWRIWLSFRNRFLKKKLREGPLSCFYCGKTPLYKNTRITPRHLRATIDHVYPRSKGGKEYDESNLAVCCTECNAKKGDRLLEDFTRSN